MVDISSPDLLSDLELRIRQRTGWRVRNLAIEMLEPERAVIRGRATTAMVRQIAESVVHDCFPHVTIENAIAVDNDVEFLPGVPLN
jgi:hypothetical protein